MSQPNEVLNHVDEITYVFDEKTLSRKGKFAYLHPFKNNCDSLYAKTRATQRQKHWLESGIEGGKRLIGAEWRIDGSDLFLEWTGLSGVLAQVDAGR